MIPHRAPTNSFSASCPSWASRTSSRLTRSNAWRSARRSATSSAALEDTPAPSGTSDSIRSSNPDGMRMTPQRQAILDAIASMRGHISADQVHRQVAERYPDVNITTVYRTLEVLEERGFLRHTHFHEDRAQYQRTDEPPHQHLVCRMCGGSQELDLSVLEPLQDDLRRRYGFEADLGHT